MVENGVVILHFAACETPLWSIYTHSKLSEFWLSDGSLNRALIGRLCNQASRFTRSRERAMAVAYERLDTLQQNGIPHRSEPIIITLTEPTSEYTKAAQENLNPVQPNLFT